MTLARLSSTPTFERIEDAYQIFLRKTWLAVPALAAFVIGIISRTAILVYPNATPRQPDYLYNVVGAYYFAFFPLMVLVLAFTRGRTELRTITFGRLLWWQIIFIGVVLGAVSQISGRIIFPFFGGKVVAPYDPNFIDSILSFIFVVFLTPISEEAMFRVVLQTYLQRYGSAIAIIGTAVIFTLFHLNFFDRTPTHDDWVRLFALILIPALILSFARRYSGSLLLTLVIHGTGNALGFLGRQDVQLPGCC